MAAGSGLPSSWRQAAASTLTGFQSAISRSPAGIRAVEMKALEISDSGMITMSPTTCADSGPLARIPEQAPAHAAE